MTSEGITPQSLEWTADDLEQLSAPWLADADPEFKRMAREAAKALRAFAKYWDEAAGNV